MRKPCALTHYENNSQCDPVVKVIIIQTHTPSAAKIVAWKHRHLTAGRFSNPTNPSRVFLWKAFMFSFSLCTEICLLSGLPNTLPRHLAEKEKNCIASNTPKSIMANLLSPRLHVGWNIIVHFQPALSNSVPVASFFLGNTSCIQPTTPLLPYGRRQGLSGRAGRPITGRLAARTPLLPNCCHVSLGKALHPPFISV